MKLSAPHPAATLGPVSIDTKQVEGRRTLRFTSLDDILADAEALAEVERRALGNWTLGQVCQHLAQPMDFCIDGFPFTLPLPIKIAGRLMKGRFLKKGFPTGAPLKGPTGVLIPQEVLPTEGLAELRRAINRLKREPQRVPSPLIGRLSREQWDQFHMRHAELHLSFILPEQS